MSDLYVSKVEVEKNNSRGDFLHLDIDYRSNAIRIDFDSSVSAIDAQGNLLIGLNATHITGVTAGKNSLPLPMPLCFTLHKAGNKYELFDMEEYKKSKDAKAAKKSVDAQPLELLILKAIEAQKVDFSANLFGFISIAGSPNDESFVSGDFPIEKYKFGIFDQGSAESLKDKKLDPTAPTGNGYSAKPAQTELARLFERQSVIKTVSNAWINQKDSTDMKVDDRDTYAFMKSALQDKELRDYLSLICGIALPDIENRTF